MQEVPVINHLQTHAVFYGGFRILGFRYAGSWLGGMELVDVQKLSSKRC